MDRGCWCRPTAPNGPGRDRLRKPRPPPSRSTIPTVTFAPAIARGGGAPNPPYPSLFFFDNVFPAMLPATPAGTEDRNGLLIAAGEPGICRVGCFSPRQIGRASGRER